MNETVEKTMKFKKQVRAWFASIMLGFTVTANAVELPLVSDIGGGAGLGLLGALPLSGSVGDSLLVNSGLPILSDLPVLGALPIIDGRGLPVVGNLAGTNMIVTGVMQVVVSNPNLNGGLPLIGSGELSVVEMLLNGGPTLNFLALDAVLPF
jgi:hypothetical protein